MTRIPGKALTRFCHEAGSDAVFGAERFDDVSKALVSIGGCRRRQDQGRGMLT